MMIQHKSGRSQNLRGRHNWLLIEVTSTTVRNFGDFIET